MCGQGIGMMSVEKKGNTTKPRATCAATLCKKKHVCIALPPSWGQQAGICVYVMQLANEEVKRHLPVPSEGTSMCNMFDQSHSDRQEHDVAKDEQG